MITLAAIVVWYAVQFNPDRPNDIPIAMTAPRADCLKAAREQPHTVCRWFVEQAK